jgi:hypothetical protein
MRTYLEHEVDSCGQLASFEVLGQLAVNALYVRFGLKRFLQCDMPTRSVASDDSNVS